MTKPVRRRKRLPSPPADTSAEAAREAGLVYVSDEMPGIVRRRSGSGFTYTAPNGRRMTDEKDLRRIRALAVPPAWTSVWICPTPRGHLQATGRDARGRKQYRYHRQWRKTRDQTKFDRMVAFGEALPGIRSHVRDHLRLPGLPREKILATVVRLIDLTAMRVGSARYAKHNGSFGLTTMRDRHVDVNGSTMRFEFRGKGGKMHAVDVRDPRLARIVKRCQEIPGQRLFQYLDDAGEHRRVDSDDVNAYLQECAGEEFTAKDFRTWSGSVLALRAFRAAEPTTSARRARRVIVEAIETVAVALGNTVAVCRACYVHPAVVEAYEDGRLATLRRRRPWPATAASADRLSADEATLLAFLRARAEGARAA